MKDVAQAHVDLIAEDYARYQIASAGLCAFAHGEHWSNGIARMAMRDARPTVGISHARAACGGSVYEGGHVGRRPDASADDTCAPGIRRSRGKLACDTAWCDKKARDQYAERIDQTRFAGMN